MRNERTSARAFARAFLSVAMLGLATGGSLAKGIDKQDFNQVEKGRYLALVGDCAACHTVSGSGHDLAGGRRIETPFGDMLAPNITPDPTTGIGAWTDDEFVNALTKGTGRNGSYLYPAMPFTYYSKLTRDDALAIRAYLDTVPAVKNPVQSNQLPFPLNIRAGLRVWDALFFKAGAFVPVAGKSAEWNRGAFLAEGPAHCGMCHTPKNFLGADKASEHLEGYALQGWFAANITNDARRGLGSWSVDDVVAYLKTGHNQSGAATGPMSETLNLSTSHLRDSDLKAIAIYLKDGPSQQESAAEPPDQKPMKAGGQIYANECSGCHNSDGKGVPGLFPSLANSSEVQQNDPTSLLRVVLRGARSVGTDQAPSAPAMPAFSWVLNDDQVAAVLTYIRNSWRNSAPQVSPSQVGKARKSFAERTD